MSTTAIELTNYIVPEFAPNGTFVASLSAIDTDTIDPQFTLIDSSRGQFAIYDNMLYTADKNSLTTVFSNIREITVKVFGETYEEIITLTVKGRVCDSTETSGTSGCCSTSGSIFPDCDAGLGYFDPLSDCYSGEDAIYQSILEEAYNTAPIPATFYVISYDTSHDEINGEDPTKTIIRKFDFNGYNEELPREDVMYSTGWGGIQGLDKFTLYVSKNHFSKQSQKDYNGVPAQYPEYIPRGGEFIMLKYSGKYYTMTHVRDSDELNLQRKNTWSFMLKVYEDNHAEFIPATSASMQDDIGSINDMEDIFDVSSIVDAEKEDILYKPKASEQSPQDPFVGWD